MALLNVLEERDIQVRGYQLRLPLDLLLVASANPEDYTNRGRIITPLKDRFGAEVRTHYPLELDDELELIAPGGAVLWRRPTRRRAARPDHLLEIVARFTRLVRESPPVDQRSGVSARFADRGGRDGRRRPPCAAPRSPARTPPWPGSCDLPAVVPAVARQGRVRGQPRRAASSRCSSTCCAGPIAETFRARLAGARPAGAAGAVRRRA